MSPTPKNAISHTEPAAAKARRVSSSGESLEDVQEQFERLRERYQRCTTSLASAAHDLKTVGDFLEWRYDSRVRASIAALLWVATLAILAGQFLAMAAVLGTIIGLGRTASCAIGAAVATSYFAAGGLKSSVVVNVLQLSVKLLGFAIALPLATEEHDFKVGYSQGLTIGLP